MKTTIFIATIVFLSLSTGCKHAGAIPSDPKLPEKAKCAYDIKRCDDGNFVGRSGTSCEFVCPEPASK